MLTNDTLVQYQKLFAAIKNQQNIPLGDLRQGCWCFDSQTFSDAKELNQALKDLNLSSGWLTLASKNIMLEDYQYNDQPLAGQACNQTLSIQINYLGSHWQLVIIEPEKGDNQGLIAEEVQLAKYDNISHLCFESLWQNIDGAMRKTAARFIGVK